jgi:hypothetical protein
MKRPTFEEFHRVLREEFRVLEEHGYRRVPEEPTGFEVRYRKGPVTFVVVGMHWGSAAMAYVVVDDAAYHSWVEVPEGYKSPIPPTDTPQLDHLRQDGYLLRTYGGEVLRASPEYIATARARQKDLQEREDRWAHQRASGEFFSEAEKLFKAGEYRAFVAYLAGSSYELSPVWRKRLEIARKRM